MNFNFRFDSNGNLEQVIEPPSMVNTSNMIFRPQVQQQQVECPYFNMAHYTVVHTPLPRRATDVHFRDNPFRKLEKILLYPSFLDNTQAKTLPSLVKCNAKYETVFDFTFCCDDVNLITTNRTAVPNKADTFNYDVQVHLRMTSRKEIPPADGQYDDFLSFGLHVRCNSKTVQLPPAGPISRNQIEGRRPGRPIHLTPYLKLSPSAKNQVIINWGDEPEPKEFVIYIELVEVLTSQILIEQLKIPSGPKMSVSDTISRIKTQFRGMELDDDDLSLAKDDDDVSTTIVRASLHCPLGRMRMKLPAIGINCAHVQCFDAELFIQMNERKSCWQCPVCSKPLCYKEMLINKYFENVAKSDQIPEECVEVQLLEDGTWQPFVEDEAQDEKPNDAPNLPDSASTCIIDENTPISIDAVVDLTSDCEDDDMTGIL